MQPGALSRALEPAIAEPGPHLIEVVVPSVYIGLRLRAMPHALRALTKLPRPIAWAAKKRFYPQALGEGRIDSGPAVP
jgi:acetolactate synthase-1/2/3 large subunit